MTSRMGRGRKHLFSQAVRSVLLEGLDPRRLLAGTVVTTIWNDTNSNGSVDGADTRLAGWTVFVDYDRDAVQDAGEPSGVTNASGVSTITGVDKGTWDVREVLQSGWAPSGAFKEFDRASVQDDRTSNVTFLNVFTGTIGTLEGRVRNDVSGDGILTPDEPGLPGWTVYLDLNTNRFFDAGEPSRITDGAGFFQFTDLAPGGYRLRQITQPNWDSTVGFDNENNVDITAGHTTVSNFANFNTAALGLLEGSIWNDLNANGFRDGGDPGLSGWTLFLDLNNDNIQQAAEPSTLSDAAGAFSFGSIAVGTYKVMEVLQPGWTVSPGFAVARTAVVVNEDVNPVSFANFTPTTGSISGVVFNDRNGDGSNVGDPGLEAWTVYIDENGDATLNAGEPSAVTDASGTYVITAVHLGSFTIRDILPIGWKATAPGTGMQLVTLLNGEDRFGVNFGNQQRTDGAIRGTAYNDVNKNGVRDAGERGLAGIPVYLDTNNNGLFDTGEPQITTSKDLFFTPAVNEAGNYEFTHLATGVYHVRQVVPDVLSATPADQRVKEIDLLTGEDRAGVNFADRFRANEIHGLIYNDLNHNHVRDPGEPGIPGVTVYIDLNRDNHYQNTEPKTVTASDGSYAFVTGLAPGNYVVRQMRHSGHDQSYPTTLDGILWPTGVSNPSIGNVSPTSITVALAQGEHSNHNVSVTLPTTGGLTNKVDVFLLFDDTGSFTGNSPIVRAAFPQIISTLQAAMPGIDFGFGVGRFEEYANFGLENAQGRPFILNQPILSQTTPGFSAAIQAALDRTAPGYGGDTPETDIEALFQTATGIGFDGNNNGTTSDSGAAGLVGTQLTPGASGDVPSFGSFTVDPAGGVLPGDGSIGGAGFRPGALPIILTATDTGFAFQPNGETSITGLNGLTLPISAFSDTSRGTTPFNSGASIQQTITALNALGALVVGLGTNGVASVDPRQGLEAISKLTGAVNRSLLTIPNGTTDPISPGDPLYFQISSGFGASVANGIVNAIENGVTSVNLDIEVKASDPSVILSSSPSVVTNVGAGQTAAFAIEFTGDGAPHRFDLQFVRAGTSVVVGSIPVVMGTPIPGDGYEYEHLDDGEIHHSSDFGNYENTSLPANVAPSFAVGSNQTVNDTAGEISIASFASGISAGPVIEAWQLLDFVLTNDSNALFAVQPAISADGTLSFTPAAGAAGTATVSIVLHDNGGTVLGGSDTSAVQTFTITVNSVAPVVINSSFQYLTSQSLLIQFSQDVASSLSIDDLAVVNIATGAAVTLSGFSYNPATHQATVSFGTTLLGDGRYRLTIAAGAVSNLTSPHVLEFFAMAGDANHDAVVNFDDLLTLAQHYGSPGDFAQGDFNYDGNVNFDDLLMLAQRYGTSLSKANVAKRRTAAAGDLLA